MQSLIQAEEIEALKEKTFIMPIHYHNHWVGIRFETNDQGIFSFTFYDSLTSEPRRRQIIQEAINSFYQFNSDYFGSTLIPEVNNFSCLQQQDGVSCGVLVIENIYKDLRGDEWPGTNVRTENVLEFRKFHRSLLDPPRQNSVFRGRPH